jgi:beta-glucosidase/6-phospho-beta-glucosidase/beta-galactosidase
MSVCIGKIGISLNINWCEPATNSTEDVAACERYQQFGVSKHCEEKRQKMCVQIYIGARLL